MCQNHSSTTCVPRTLNSVNYALEQALLADDIVNWEHQRLLMVEALEAGASVDHAVPHMHGNLITALYLAVIKADTELIKFLIQKGPNPNLELYDNSTIFSYVDSLVVAQCLVDCGVKLYERSGAMFGGLLHGLMQPVPQAVDLIAFYLAHGANPNLPDWSGDTPLHVLARVSGNYAQHLDLLQHKVIILRDAGADVGIKNLAGKMPVDLIKNADFMRDFFS